MVAITRTRSLLTFTGLVPSGNAVFQAIRSDGEDIERERQVEMDYGTFADLGEPETITVTIEPGDLLND